jgi:acyl-CoA dehydrogenase
MVQSLSTDEARRDADALLAAQHLAREALLPGAAERDQGSVFPTEALAALADAGLLGMAIDQEYGGLALTNLAQAQIFGALTAGDVTTAFVASQHHACTTLAQVAQTPALRDRWLPGLASGALRGANGFNFLNFPPERAPMRAELAPGGFRLRGALPWVTAAHHSDLLVAGAVLPDAQQLLVAIPLRATLMGNTPELTVDPPMDLLGLAASDTTVVRCADYFVPTADVVLGPGFDLLKAAGRHSATFVPTAMTLGHSHHCLSVIAAIAEQKGGTAREIATWLASALQKNDAELVDALTAGAYETMPQLRGAGNALVAKAAYLALIVGGGTGYRRDQVAQRLYREAGFFQVWSVSGAIIPATLTHVLNEGM